jgi:hypothetical protein
MLTREEIMHFRTDAGHLRGPHGYAIVEVHRATPGQPSGAPAPLLPTDRCFQAAEVSGH